MAENFVSKVFSNYVEIQVYEKITKVRSHSSPFESFAGSAQFINFVYCYNTQSFSM